MYMRGYHDPPIYAGHKEYCYDNVRSVSNTLAQREIRSMTIPK